MTLEEKQGWVDKELRRLTTNCLHDGYSHKQLRKAARPFASAIRTSRRRKWLPRLKLASLLVMSLVALAYLGPKLRFVKAAVRRVGVAVIPYWDWSVLHDRDCVIENPLFKGVTVSKYDCEICESLQVLRRVRNTTQTTITNRFLKRDIPVIVEDGTRPEDSDNISIAYLSEVFRTHPILNDYPSCRFMSNVRVKYGNHRAFLQQAGKGEITEYYAHWENCYTNAGKAFRHFFKRPYFLPAMVQLSETNWIFLSSEFQGKKPKRVPIYRPMVMLMQLRGSMRVFLEARGPCGTECPTLTEVLEEGDILVTTDFLWDVRYLPGRGGENVAIGVGGRFD
jgi:hypothetical protein